MTDRELLELAALAIGRRISDWVSQGGIEVAVLDDQSYWQPLLKNPITDCMGDALRLAVRLGICVEFGECLDDAPIVMCGEAFNRESWPQTPNFPDRYAATRLAIVRAAAEIGRRMKEAA